MIIPQVPEELARDARLASLKDPWSEIVAADVGMSLRPTEVVILGNAKGGTLLMQARQVVGINLPLIMLVYREASGRVSSAYERYGFGARVVTTVNGMASARKSILAQVTESFRSLW